MTASYDEELVQNIVDAANRGAELTGQMLAYARKQPLKATQFNLSDLVESKMGLLARTLGATIAITFHADPDLWTVSADAGQVEDALLNLVINAQQAMPDGGSLLIECRNATVPKGDPATPFRLEPGDYVVLSVADDGCGMTPEILERATDPFFSTKGADGSGLGLSMVYGFASQSGGQLAIESSPAAGAKVELYLPRARGEVAPQSIQQERAVPLSQGERILVIEDDPAVRKTVERVLASLRYGFLSAYDAGSAREILKEDDRFDLVLSDVVLPNGTSGPEFAKEIRAVHPDLKIMFMSGYPADEDGIAPERPILKKPFQRGAAARAIRQALQE